MSYLEIYKIFINYSEDFFAVRLEILCKEGLGFYFRINPEYDPNVHGVEFIQKSCCIFT